MSRSYVLRRILALIPTLLAIYTLTFLLIHATPGGPWDTGDTPLSPQVIENLEQADGLRDALDPWTGS